MYECNSRCSGFGNRIHGITILLLFAILSNRTFLIEMNHPLDINRLLHPNAIKWNYTGYRNINNMVIKRIGLIDTRALNLYWPSFSKQLFNPDVHILKVRTNLGFPYYFKMFDDKWNKLFRDHFDITKDDISTYGCVVRYLFTYDKIVTDAINKEMEELGLVPRLYVSVHFRSYFDAPGLNLNPAGPTPFLSRGVEIANNMSKNSNKSFEVYFITDSFKAKEIANTKYEGQVLTSHVKEAHVDKVKGSILESFIGVLVNIEVAAMGAVFVRSGSTFSDLIESIGQFNEESVSRLN